jgi:hypothetical protein
MQWSQLRKRIEGRLAESVRKRIRLGFTIYRKSHDHGEGRGSIEIDGVQVLDMSTYRFVFDYYDGPDRGTEARKLALHDKNIFEGWSWRTALEKYLNLSFIEILAFQHPLIRAVGMLDARLGRRRLRSLDVSREHALVKRLYYLRCESEGIRLENIPKDHAALTSRLSPPTSMSAQYWRAQLAKAREGAGEKLTGHRRSHRLRHVIKSSYAGRLPTGEPLAGVAQVIADGLAQAADREALYDLLSLAESKTKLLKEVRHTRGIVHLARKSAQWLRPPGSWLPESHNADRQFSSLARHLWATYPIPLFMDSAWCEDKPAQQQWFRHLGAGRNIRTADDLPISLTKKMAHHFLEAPDNYSVEAALRWGQVFALGGDRCLADAVRESRLAREFRDDAFWLSVLRFLVQNPLLDRAQVGPIVDYIWNQRYEPRVIFPERGVARELGPAQPNFSMRGRTATALLRAVEEWHRQLGREMAGQGLQWAKSNVPDFRHIEGSANSGNMSVWQIRELLSSDELIAEGRAMHHCVASYARSCHAGRTSIWSMDEETAGGGARRLTIEVDRLSGQIVQARGEWNRVPTSKEKDILRRWALQAEL